MQGLTRAVLLLLASLSTTCCTEDGEEDGHCEKESECDDGSKRHNIYRNKDEELLVYTVATAETDGYRRYLQSAEFYKIEPRVLGFGEHWQGGDNIKLYTGGGWKVNLLKDALQKVAEENKDSSDKIVLFTDGYDVMFLSNLEAIKTAFKKTGFKVLFGAEAACWPDKTLESNYPVVKPGNKRFLNSGMFIGYLPELLKVVTHAQLENTEDDQLFYTRAYLDGTFRKEVNIGLDSGNEIFQNLNGAISEVEITITKEHSVSILQNTNTHTTPLLIHGNGPSKLALNSFSNYLAGAWTQEEGCQNCKWGHIALDEKSTLDYPSVLVAVFVEMPTPFLAEQLQKIHRMDYPKEKLHLFIHSSVKFHLDTIEAFTEEFSKDFASFKQITAEDGVSEWNARDLSLDRCLSQKCDYYFSLDSIAHLDNPHALKLLIEQNRSVVAPLLARPGKAWSNFWGALTTDGFYARSNDYMDIVHNHKRGLWNVPYIAHCYLINAKVLHQYDRTKINYSRGNLDADMAFCANIRDLDIFLFVSNRVDFGHLVNPESYDVTLVEPDMYQIFDNEQDWEGRFIHPDYAANLNEAQKSEEPCQDVYRFPVVTRTFCTALIHMMEAFGRWSDGSNSDTRLEGGYEAVPTRDIHMNQVGWEGHWMEFLARYVRPLQEHVFTGYIHDPPRSLMNFVVRYRPNEQPSLRPHHDSSTYTINLALNERGVDFEGGGCRFIRYDCSIVDTKPGWLLMHPGRLTHYHEGLLVTNGTRYIMISFIDP